MLKRLWRWLFYRERLLRLDVISGRTFYSEFYEIHYWIWSSPDAHALAMVVLRYQHLPGDHVLRVVDDGWMSGKLVWLIDMFDIEVISPHSTPTETGGDDDE